MSCLPQVQTKTERELAYVHGVRDFPGLLLFQVIELLRIPACVHALMR